jgi:inositol oxygenase
MAPALLLDDPASPILTPTRDGLALEETTDNIEHVNILKAALQSKNESPMHAKSQFDSSKDKSQFRQYEAACSRVKNFYAEQHAKQTVEYNLKARESFLNKTRAEMGIWEAMEKLNTLVDESDPDTELSQIEHLIQSAEAIRRDGKPRWMQLTGLIHDLGKLLFFFGAEGQWDVVGDTFPVGCKFSDTIILPETFSANPDVDDPVYSTEHGIYTPGCGMDNVMLSWGHDEYLYHVVKDQSLLPDEALAMIRYHSFYPWHREGGYEWMMSGRDWEMREAVRAFNPYDLYSKNDEVPTVWDLKEYYLDLIDEFFPQKKIRW